MAAALLLLGYLCGSVPFGVLITRWRRGVDVRSAGSGNIGATNVTRVAGKRLGALVLLLDALKGALPVLLCVRLQPANAPLHAAVGLAAFFGHVYPVWLRLRGGKGVATALGVLLALVPQAALAGAAVYVLTVAARRVSSLGSLLGAVTAVAVALSTAREPAYGLLALLLLLLVVWTHRGNIARIARRSERRF